MAQRLGSISSILKPINRTATSSTSRARANLIKWETSPLNPVLAASPEDKQIANPRLTPEQCNRIAKATNVNNSDIDFCEFNGRLIINYSWGNQRASNSSPKRKLLVLWGNFSKAGFPTWARGQRTEVTVHGFWDFDCCLAGLRSVILCASTTRRVGAGNQVDRFSWRYGIGPFCQRVRLAICLAN